MNNSSEQGPHGPTPESEPIQPALVLPPGEAMLRQPELAIAFLADIRQRLVPIVGALPQSAKVAELAAELNAEFDTAVYTAMQEADDPTMSLIDRRKQWYAVERALGDVDEEEITADLADVWDSTSEEDRDPATFNAYVQENRRQHPRNQ